MCEYCNTDSGNGVINVFTRSKDLHQYVNLLENVAFSMARTISKVSGYDVDEIMYEYARIASGPTTLEEILIGHGKYTIEEFNKNWVEKNLIDMVCGNDITHVRAEIVR